MQIERCHFINAKGLTHTYTHTLTPPNTRTHTYTHTHSHTHVNCLKLCFSIKVEAIYCDHFCTERNKWQQFPNSLSLIWGIFRKENLLNLPITDYIIGLITLSVIQLCCLYCNCYCYKLSKCNNFYMSTQNYILFKKFHFSFWTESFFNVANDIHLIFD
jgi:hypothetical protein